MSLIGMLMSRPSSVGTSTTHPVSAFVRKEKNVSNVCNMLQLIYSVMMGSDIPQMNHYPVDSIFWLLGYIL